MSMMSSFDRFRRRNKKDVSCNFLTRGINSIKFWANDQYHTGSIVYNNKRNGNPDEVFVYVDINDHLDVGTVISTNKLHIIILQEDKFVYNVQFKRYYGFSCNYEIDGLWGYFKGKANSYIGIDLQSDNLLLSKAQPIFITQSGTLEIKDIIIINDRPWKIIECDDYSYEGVSFYSLEATVLPSSKTATYETTDSTSVVEAGEEITLSTEDGYFKSSDALLNIKKTQTEVTFEVPYDITKFKVSVKSNGVVTSMTFEVQ